MLNRQVMPFICARIAEPDHEHLCEMVSTKRVKSRKSVKSTITSFNSPSKDMRPANVVFVELVANV
jgi:hypothetical protein